MKKEKNKFEEVQNKFIEEYNELMSTHPANTETVEEWHGKGDQIEKFSLYDNYTPISTSNETSLLS